MLSPADMVIIGAAALIFFGPDQLPKVARRAGQVIRDVQNTSQSFVREMERAADLPEPHHDTAGSSNAYEYRSYEESIEPAPAPTFVHPFASYATPESEPARPAMPPVPPEAHRDDASGI
ncbi:MAG: hypothetical protein NVSMB21_13170 [Vulcanimicrobiaceae bacterium]